MSTMLRERFLAAIRSVRLIVVAALAVSACESGPNPSAAGSETRTVPAGWFLKGENDGRESNQPHHRVYLDPFEIQLTEVTRSQFIRFLLETGSVPPGFQEFGQEKGANMPVVGVVWREADAYCHWIGMRLPTEAEPLLLRAVPKV